MVNYNLFLGLRQLAAILLVTVFSSSAIKAQDIKLEAPQSVPPGEEFEVVWTGPGDVMELIVISTPGAEFFPMLSNASTQEGNPVTLTAPEVGNYEIRYVTMAGMKTLAAIPLVVSVAPAEAEPVLNANDEGDAVEEPVLRMLFALRVVDTGADFHTIWTGNSNEGDLLLLRDESSEILAKQPLLSGTPMRVTAPSEPGHYSLQYFHKASRMIAFRRELEVR